MNKKKESYRPEKKFFWTKKKNDFQKEISVL